jgi:hypothetical protein
MVQYIGGFLSVLFFKEEAAILCIKEKWNHQDLEDLQLWNSFSYYPAITTFDFLIGQRCKYLGKG